jgi:hypothetical protein
MEKPTALWNARPSSTFAQAQLAETLTVMMAAISTEASITVPVTNNRLDEAGVVGDDNLAAALVESLRALTGDVNKAG